MIDVMVIGSRMRDVTLVPALCVSVCVCVSLTCRPGVVVVEEVPRVRLMPMTTAMAASTELERAGESDVNFRVHFTF